MLPALPSLRGLSKAIRGAEIAGVVVGVALRLRSLRFKDMDKRPMLRCGIASRKGSIEICWWHVQREGVGQMNSCDTHAGSNRSVVAGRTQQRSCFGNVLLTKKERLAIYLHT